MWYEMDDDDVKQVSAASVRQVEAYMLYYVQVDNKEESFSNTAPQLLNKKKRKKANKFLKRAMDDTDKGEVVKRVKVVEKKEKEEEKKEVETVKKEEAVKKVVESRYRAKPVKRAKLAKVEDANTSDHDSTSPESHNYKKVPVGILNKVGAQVEAIERKIKKNKRKSSITNETKSKDSVFPLTTTTSRPSRSFYFSTTTPTTSKWHTLLKGTGKLIVDKFPSKFPSTLFSKRSKAQKAEARKAEEEVQERNKHEKHVFEREQRRKIEEELGKMLKEAERVVEKEKTKRERGKKRVDDERKENVPPLSKEEKEKTKRERGKKRVDDERKENVPPLSKEEKKAQKRARKLLKKAKKERSMEEEVEKNKAVKTEENERGRSAEEGSPKQGI